ncbi:MAG: hypothetical protein HXY50_14370 [Ignavibacteriaceae bacterium]|nr:hypothetical protein [Ignavibacteriaceae bacterium]
MKIDNRIILYFDNQLNEIEKKEFEKELSNSDLLLRQVEFYKQSMQFLKLNVSENIDENYFINLIPRFRSKQNKKKFTILSKNAITINIAASIVLTLIFLFSLLKIDRTDKISDLISTLNSNESIDLYDYYIVNSDHLTNSFANSDDSLLTDVLYTEFDLHETDIVTFIEDNGIEMENMLSDIEPEEMISLIEGLNATKTF